MLIGFFLIIMEKVKDSESVLFQFLNENNEMKVGFRSFLENPISNKELANIVRDEKVIAKKWPMCDIVSATKMNNLLKASLEFSFKVARVIAFGGKLFTIICISARCKKITILMLTFFEFCFI